MHSRELIAWNLRKLRVAKGLSQEALAEEAGIARAYVSRIERGLENPTIALLDRLARALAVGIVTLFSGKASGERPPQPMTAGRKPPVRKKRRSKR